MNISSTYSYRRFGHDTYVHTTEYYYYLSMDLQNKPPRAGTSTRFSMYILRTHRYTMRPQNPELPVLSSPFANLSNEEECMLPQRQDYGDNGDYNMQIEIHDALKHLVRPHKRYDPHPDAVTRYLAAVIPARHTRTS